jgi:hypothetical protein
MQKKLSAPVFLAATLLVGLGCTSAALASGVVSTCDETNLQAALSGGGAVTFACSGDIMLSGGLSISSNTSIDGTGQSVTLDGQGSVQVLSVKVGVTLWLNNLTIANGSQRGGLGGGIFSEGTLIVANSTFSGNSASGGGSGGGISMLGGTLIVTNSTFSGNSASGGGLFGGLGGGIFMDGGTLIVTNSTFSGNSASGGGGIHYTGNATLENTILTGNSGRDCGERVTDGGYNLDDDGSCGFTSSTSFSDNKNANLGSLSNNGGPTKTIALVSGSAAIGVIPAGTNGCATSIAIDQRGVARPGSVNGNCSMGAYEYVPAANATITDCSSDSQLQTAMRTGGRIVFTCSGDIKVTRSLSIASNTTIDATGQSVTLDRQNGAEVLLGNPGVTLSLNNLTIANGNGGVEGGGGILNNVGTVIVTNSTFSGNSASGADGGGGIYSNAGTVIVTNSTFSLNSASGSGDGGGISMNHGTLTVTNSTFSGNSASEGGGIYNNGGTLTATNSTFSGNSASGGGGINGNATLENTILASNTGGNCTGTFTDGGYNLDDDGSCGLSSANHSFSDNQNANLGSLSNNGGPTQTIPFNAGSVAIDAIPLLSSGCGGTILTDQRGVFRPQGPACDIGAFETTQVPVTFNTSPANLSYMVGSTSYTSQQTLTLPVGNKYTISTTSPQVVSSGVYEFSSWSDNESISHTVTAVATTTSYTATFTQTATNVNSEVTPTLRAIGYNKNTGVSTFNYTITNKSTTKGIPGPIQVVMLNPANGGLAVNKTGIVEPQGYAYWTINSALRPKATVGIILEVVTHNPATMLTLGVYSGHF